MILQRGRQDADAQRLAEDQHVAVARITLKASRLTAFLGMQTQGFEKRRDCMCRRGEAPLAGAIEDVPLIVHVEAERMAAPSGFDQR